MKHLGCCLPAPHPAPADTKRRSGLSLNCPGRQPPRDRLPDGSWPFPGTPGPGPGPMVEAATEGAPGHPLLQGGLRGGPSRGGIHCCEFPQGPPCLSQLPPATPSLQLSTARKGEPGAAKALGGCSGPDSQMGGTVPSAGQAPWSLGNQQQESGAFCRSICKAGCPNGLE